MPTSNCDASLKGRVCVITGANRGLGQAMSEALFDAGAIIVAVDIADPAPPSDAELTRLRTGRLIRVSADVRLPHECQSVIYRTMSTYGAIHVLINNAGVGTREINPSYDTKPLRFWELTIDDWQKLIDVNLNGMFYLTHAATPHMVQTGFGRIVNISTGWITMARYGDSPYGPSKAALESCTAIWAKELASTGVTCNALTPGGPVDTKLARGPVAGQRVSDFLKPDIMAAPVLWLASDSSASWTGCRFIAKDWDPNLSSEESAARSASPVHETPTIRSSRGSVEPRG